MNKSKQVLVKDWKILCLENIDGEVLGKRCEILCLKDTDGQGQGQREREREREATRPGSSLLCELISREIAISGGTADDSYPST